MWCGQIFLAWSGIEIQSTSWIHDAIEMHSACQHVGKNLPMAGQNVVKISVKAGLARMMRPIFIWNQSCDVVIGCLLYPVIAGSLVATVQVLAKNQVRPLEFRT